MDAAIPFRHGPVRKTLVEITSQESNERRMDPRISVEAVHGLEPVTMPYGSGRLGSRRRDSAADRVETRIPQTTHRSPLIVRAITHLA